MCQIITQLRVNFLRSIWKNLHQAKIFYASAACGVCDKYKARSLPLKALQELQMLSTVTLNCWVTKIVMNLSSQLSEL